eukprot:633653_1
MSAFPFTQCVVFSLVTHWSLVYAAILSFIPSNTNVPDEYCLEESNNYGPTTHCDDIDNILINYCGNTAFLATIQYENPLNHMTHECVFHLDDQQTIAKTYVLSNRITLNRIRFISSNDTTIILAQPFLSITSYQRSIEIIDIAFTSNGNRFSFIHISPDNPKLDLTLELCDFNGINAQNGSIINIPHTNGIFDHVTHEISIVFQNCIIENTAAEYGGILYIERNNVYVTFSECDVSHGIASGNGAGGMIHWICQPKQYDVDLCGDVLIFASDIHSFDNNVFTIDLSLDPSQIQFNLDVDTATFTNINGTIFNFNHNDDALSPTGHRIQEQNVFINVVHSRFEENGLNRAPFQQWNYRSESYIEQNGHTQNGTIFTINSWAVPNITIESSNFTDNAALFGTIFHWYCSRKVRWIKDNYCGSIALQNSVFRRNKLDQNEYFARYGSLLYGQIHSNMQFNLLIDRSQFIEHVGHLIYLEKSTVAIPDVNPNEFWNVFNYTFPSNYSIASNMSTNLTSSISFLELESSISMIYVENSRFIGNEDMTQTDVGVICTLKGLPMVYTFISESSFEENVCTSGSAVFSAEYSPMIRVSHSNFTGNAALDSGLLDIRKEEDAIVEIYDSRFVNNGWYDPGDHAGKVSIVSTGDTVFVSLDIVRSSFIENKHGKHGCFGLLYTADIRIFDSEFESNEGYLESVIILYLKGAGHLNISHSIFNDNREVSAHFDTGNPEGMFNIQQADVVTDHVVFTNNTVTNNGIYVTTQPIKMAHNTFIDNSVPWISNEAPVVHVSDSKFEDNHVSSLFSYDGDGFAMAMSQSNFISNTANALLMNGSVVSVRGSNIDIDMEQCVFDDNRAYNGFGGALYTEGDGTASLTNCTIFSSYANGGGGFMFATGQIAIDISDTEATYGYTHGFGGFMYMKDVALNMNRVLVTESHAHMSGGAVFAERSIMYAEDCEFESNSAGFGGGGIYVLRTEFTCDRCDSRNNYAATRGGFLYVDRASTVYMNNADLVSDRAQSKGGTVFITNTSTNTSDQCHFECDDCIIFNATADYGAMLVSQDGNVIVLNDIEVSECKASQSSVLSIYNNHVTVTRSTFESNEAGSAVGVIHLARDSTMMITESTFSDNSGGTYAGAIYAGDNNILNISHSIFERNSALIGGAIAIQTGYAIDKQQNLLMYTEITNTSFVDNIAYGLGGSMWIQRSGSIDSEDAELYAHHIRLVSNTWNRNKAVQGGALWMGFDVGMAVGSGSACYTGISAQQSVDIINNTFNNNYAANHSNGSTNNMNSMINIGGAFYFSCLNAQISETHFDSCHADAHGGVGYVRGSNVSIDECSFTSDDMVQNNGQLFHVLDFESSGNMFHMKRSVIHGFTKADDDASIYSLMTIEKGISAILFDNVRFYENEIPLFYQQAFACPLVRFYQCYFEYNQAYSIIRIDQTTRRLERAITEFESVEFKYNEVTMDLVRLSTSYANIIDCSIENNVNHGLLSTFIHVVDATIDHTEWLWNAGLYEGILSIDHYATTIIQHSEFRHNQVDVRGGAIASYAETLTINNCTFDDNSADLAGGHLVHYEGELYISESTFSYGSTKGNGGAIWRDRYSTRSDMITHITNTIFVYNIAGFHAGAIFHGTISKNKETHLVLDDVQFMHNEANISGAAIYIRNRHDITLDVDNGNVHYVRNTAHQIAGDMISWPTQVHVSSDVDTFCPNCTVDITVYTTDLFGNVWPPHDFKEYVLPSMNISDLEHISSLKDTAIVLNNSIDIKHSMSSKSGAQFNTILDIHRQSPLFTKGNGTETFAYYPAIFDDDLTLTVIGLTSDGSTVFDSQSIDFQVTECLPHQGALQWPDHNGFKCDWCDPGHFRLIPTHTEICHTCQTGLRCDGGKNIFVENDYYPVFRTSETSFESELQAIECAPGTCCLAAECSIWETSSLCPAHRDGSSRLCAQCNEGYSASPYGNECMVCDGWSIAGGFGYMYFLFPFFFYGGLIWWWGRKHTFDASLSFWEIYIFKTLMFFYQVTPSIHIVIPDPSETTNAADIVEGIFNFQIPLPNICAFNNMTNLQKMLLSLAMPITCIVWLFIFWALEKMGCCARLNRKSARCALKFFMFKTVVKFLVNVYAVITRLSLSLLKCNYFDDGTTGLYYAADTECWKPWSALPVLGAVMAGVAPILLILKLYTDRKHRNRSAIWHLLTLGYKKRAWWYEAYRMFCRLFVICFVVISVPELHRLSWIRNATFMFLIIHLLCLPFCKRYRHDLGFDINHTETLCLFVLCILSILADYPRGGVLKAYTILKLVPLAMIPVIVAWKYILHWKFKSFVPEQRARPQNSIDLFRSPRSDAPPMYLNKDEESDESDFAITPHRRDDDDDEYDEKEQASFLLAPPKDRQSMRRNDTESRDSQDYGLGIRMPSERQYSNRAGSFTSRSAKAYSALSQVESDDEEDDDDDVQI